MSDEPVCPLPPSKLRAWKHFAMTHPWRGNVPLADRRHFVDTTAMLEPGRPIRLALSFDVGYHGSGWFANSEWEQNLHLSMSHPRQDRRIVIPSKINGVSLGQRGMDLETVSDEEARAWGRVVFGEHASKVWFEPAAPVFDAYRSPNVVHLRLFYDEHRQPFMPEGEPYTLKPWADGTSPDKIFRR